MINECGRIGLLIIDYLVVVCSISHNLKMSRQYCIKTARTFLYGKEEYRKNLYNLVRKKFGEELIIPRDFALIKLYLPKEKHKEFLSKSRCVGVICIYTVTTPNREIINNLCNFIKRKLNELKIFGGIEILLAEEFFD